MPRLKVVAHKKSGQVLKGYADLSLPVADESFPDPAPLQLPKELLLQPLTAGKALHVGLDSLKAIFFVRSFEGDQSYAETKFFNPAPKIEGLWVHLTFEDGETTEGIVHNGITLLNGSGFLMKPPDPQSNNEAVYVMKSALATFRVVGVRANY
jgi:Family of unknown function (DUF6982)